MEIYILVCLAKLEMLEFQNRIKCYFWLRQFYLLIHAGKQLTEFKYL